MEEATPGRDTARIARSIGAITAGFGVLVVALAILNSAVARLGLLSTSPTVRALLGLVPPLVAGVLGGYVSALLAPGERRWHSAVVGALFLGVAVAAVLRGELPPGNALWVGYAMVLAGPVGALAGAALYERNSTTG